MNPQFKRGILEFLVLKTIKDEPRSGYEVLETLGREVDVGLNTIYPILRRLAKKGLCTPFPGPACRGFFQPFYCVMRKNMVYSS